LGVGLFGEAVAEAIVVGVAPTVATGATVVAEARAAVVAGAIVAVVSRTGVVAVAPMVVADSLEGVFVPGVDCAGVEAIDEGVVFALSVEPVDIEGAVTGPVGALSTIAA
jgi:hypothetical protein